MLTDREIEKLDKRDPTTSKANDYIVRRKFKKWLDGLYVVDVHILWHLPPRQLLKLIKYEHISHLANIIFTSLTILGAVPITQTREEGYYVVTLPNRPPRPADNYEVQLNEQITTLIFNLFGFLSSDDTYELTRDVISEKMPDYAIVKKDRLRKMDIEKSEGKEIK